LRVLCDVHALVFKSAAKQQPELSISPKKAEVGQTLVDQVLLTRSPKAEKQRKEKYKKRGRVDSAETTQSVGSSFPLARGKNRLRNMACFSQSVSKFMFLLIFSPSLDDFMAEKIAVFLSGPYMNGNAG
jgi:hypothetical protein